MSNFRAPSALAISAVEDRLGIVSKRTKVTLDTSGSTTDISNFIPAGAMIIGIMVEVGVEVGGTYIDKIGVDGDADLFVDGLGSGTLQQVGDIVTTGGPIWASARGAYFGAADTLRLTCRATPSGGQVKVVMVYIDGKKF